MGLGYGVGWIYNILANILYIKVHTYVIRTNSHQITQDFINIICNNLQHRFLICTSFAQIHDSYIQTHSYLIKINQQNQYSI